jgi:hypothetical protein
MTTYRLPEALGGGEVEIVPDPSATHPPMTGYVRVVIESAEESFPIDLPFSVLTKVERPLPPEPPPGSVVLVGADADDPLSGYVYRHYHGAWAVPGEEDFTTWAGVCKLGIPVRLVPDPFAEPVELPWRANGRGTGLSASIEVGNGAMAGAVYVRLVTPSAAPIQIGIPAREMARALWAAADAAEATP